MNTSIQSTVLTTLVLIFSASGCASGPHLVDILPTPEVETQQVSNSKRLLIIADTYAKHGQNERAIRTYEMLAQSGGELETVEIARQKLAELKKDDLGQLLANRAAPPTPSPAIANNVPLMNKTEDVAPASAKPSSSGSLAANSLNSQRSERTTAAALPLNVTVAQPVITKADSNEKPEPAPVLSSAIEPESKSLIDSVVDSQPIPDVTDVEPTIAQLDDRASADDEFAKWQASQSFQGTEPSGSVAGNELEVPADSTETPLKNNADAIANSVPGWKAAGESPDNSRDTSDAGPTWVAASTNGQTEEKPVADNTSTGWRIRSEQDDAPQVDVASTYVDDQAVLPINVVTSTSEQSQESPAVAESEHALESPIAELPADVSVLSANVTESEVNEAEKLARLAYLAGEEPVATPEIITSLTALLNHEDTAVRLNAAEALFKLGQGTDKAFAVFRATLKSEPEDNLRILAMHCLSSAYNLRTDETYDLLSRQLVETPIAVQRQAALILGGYQQHSQQIIPILALLFDSHAEADVRDAAALSLDCLRK